LANWNSGARCAACSRAVRSAVAMRVVTNNVYVLAQSLRSTCGNGGRGRHADYTGHAQYIAFCRAADTGWGGGAVKALCLHMGIPRQNTNV
jgi:hypothetical protein